MLVATSVTWVKSPSPSSGAVVRITGPVGMAGPASLSFRSRNSGWETFPVLSPTSACLGDTCLPGRLPSPVDTRSPWLCVLPLHSWWPHSCVTPLPGGWEAAAAAVPRMLIKPGAALESSGGRGSHGPWRRCGSEQCRERGSSGSQHFRKKPLLTFQGGSARFRLLFDQLC